MKKRLPAYGKLLLEARDRGECRDGAVVIFGEEWREVDKRPRVCIKPGDYGLGKVQLRLLQNLAVDIIDRDYHWEEHKIEGQAPVYWLAAEIAQIAAPVRVWEYSFESRGYWKHDIAEIAYVMRTWSKHAGGVKLWPAWWPDDIRIPYHERCQARMRQHLREIGERIEAEA